MAALRGQPPPVGELTLTHPVVGPLTLTYQRFAVPAHPGILLVVHSAEPGSPVGTGPRPAARGHGDAHASRAGMTAAPPHPGGHQGLRRLRPERARSRELSAPEALGAGSPRRRKTLAPGVLGESTGPDRVSAS
nr:hypothetical protein [Streptomyces sp. SA3_actF]